MNSPFYTAPLIKPGNRFRWQIIPTALTGILVFCLCSLAILLWWAWSGACLIPWWRGERPFRLLFEIVRPFMISVSAVFSFCSARSWWMRDFSFAFIYILFCVSAIVGAVILI